MSTKVRHKAKGKQARGGRGTVVSTTVISRFASAVAERFQPEKIILLGSHAYGKPHAESDDDILVIMPCRNQLDQAYKIRLAVAAPFPMDLIVRTPKNIGWRLKEGECFHTEIVTKGKVLYEKGDTGVGRQNRGRLPSRHFENHTTPRDTSQRFRRRFPHPTPAGRAAARSLR